MTFRCNRTCKFRTLVGIGIILTTSGSLLVAYWTKIFDTFMNMEIQIAPSSLSYPIWKDIEDLPLFMEFYFFNWENPQDIFNHSIKPRFVERGPYVFSEKRLKVIEKWNDENRTVTFRQNRTWYFEPELSIGSLDDEITSLDAVAIIAPYALRNSQELLQRLLELAMNFFNTKYYMKKRVRELIFDGYDDPLWTLARLLPPGIIPLEIPFKKFAWLSERNGSADFDGMFNMHTGVGDISRVGSLGKWNYSNRTRYYDYPCDMTNGSAGEIFPTRPKKDSISVFASDFCRSFNLAYKEEVDVDGIHAYRFWGDRKLFGHPSTEPKNSCFCSEERGECWPDGLTNVTTCKWGAPIFVSFPHFFHGHSNYTEAVDGLTSQEEKHQMTIDLEEISGFPLQVNVPFQINVLLEPMKDYALLRDMPKIIFPILWFKQSFSLDDELRGKLKLFVFFSKFGDICSIVLTCAGVVLLLFSLLLYRVYDKDEL